MRVRPQLPLTIILAVGLQVFAAGIALASPPELFPNIEATSVVCVGDRYVISYRSWTDVEVENPQIDIFFNGNKVGQGEYSAANNGEFTGSAPSPSGPGSTVVVSAVAIGAWGGGKAGGQQASVNVVIPSEACTTTTPATGRFTGGGKQIDFGYGKVTRGLTLHCDLLLSNNLEINWGVGENFHMTQHTSARCSDDDAIDQRPPVAPLDRMDGEGVGRYNNQDGYSIRFTLIDAGEPGVDDQMSMLIFETANPANVVLNVPLQFLVGGNLQAHFDQPHK